MDLTPNHKLSDHISHVRVCDPNFRRVAMFPAILRDHNDYVGIMPLQGERIDDPMLAFVIDLIRWGYEKLESPGALKSPLAEGEELDVPNYKHLPYKMRLACGATRPTAEFFTFRMEMPPSLKWSVKNEKKRVKSNTRFDYGTLCQGPRGLTAVYGAHGSGFDAAALWAIQMGCMLKSCDNGISNIHVDDTKERLAFLRGRMSAPDFVKVVEDTGWSNDTRTSNPRRGINDFNRKVKFERQPTAEEMSVYKESLSLDECPGYTGILVTDIGENTFGLRTTWDSSD